MLRSKSQEGGRVYLDYAASTPVAPEVLEAMQPYFGEKFGNPGSLHFFGQEAIAAVDKARETLAKAIGANFREVIFTGSATEANNLALCGAVEAARTKNPKIIVSIIEHESVLETTRRLERDGAEIVFLPVNREGRVDPERLRSLLDERTVVISVMYLNNEIGALEPVAGISEIISEFRGGRPLPLFHTDAAQAFQFFNCNVNELGVDLMTLSGQKIYGPKGVGALYIRSKEQETRNKRGGDFLSRVSNRLFPIVTGGGQEFGLRSGTENVPAIVGFAEAAGIVAKNREEASERIAKMRDYFWGELKRICPRAELNGSPRHAPHILNVYFPGHKAEDLLTKLDLKGLAASAGSACSARSHQLSYVIKALGYSEERAVEHPFQFRPADDERGIGCGARNNRLKFVKLK